MLRVTPRARNGQRTKVAATPATFRSINPPPPPHHFHPQPSTPPFCKHYSLSNHRPSPVIHPTSLYHHCTDTHITALHGTSPLTFTLCTMHWRICILRVTFDLLLLFLGLLLLLSFSFRHRQRKQSSKAEQNFPHGHCILVKSSGQIQVKTAPVLLQPILPKLHCSDFFLHALFVFAVCSLFLFP